MGLTVTAKRRLAANERRSPGGCRRDLPPSVWIIARRQMSQPRQHRATRLRPPGALRTSRCGHHVKARIRHPEHPQDLRRVPPMKAPRVLMTGAVVAAARPAVRVGQQARGAGDLALVGENVPDPAARPCPWFCRHCRM